MTEAKPDHSQRWVYDPADFNSHKVSPSRLNSYVSCGVAFRKKYIEGLPEQTSGSASLFGLVLHDALETWSPDRTQDLVTLTAASWLKVGEGTPVVGFVKEYQAISIRAMKQEQTIRDAWKARGKESKAPRMTKDWKESQVAKDINKLLAKWIPKLNAGSPWQFSDRDSLPTLYDESLVVAARYQRKWRHLPKSLHAELGFTVEWNGYTLNGFIDFIEPLVTDGELIAYLVGDYKTYAKEPAEQKDWRQVCMYDVAIADLRARGVLDFLNEDIPVIICIDYVRLGIRKYWRLTGEDHAQLLTELEMFSKAVDAGVFLPADKSRNTDWCPYPDDCCLKTKGEGLGTSVNLNQELPA